MTIQKIGFHAGVDVQKTPTLNQGGWSASNLIRFRNSLIEKIGGWISIASGLISSGLSSNYIGGLGIVRALWTFQDLSNIKYLAIGSNTNLQLYSDSTGSVVDITPIIKTSNLATPFTTSTSDNTHINVTDAAHGASAGDQIYIPLLSSVNEGTNNAILNGIYTIVSVVDANNYTINAQGAVITHNGVSGNTSLFTTTNTSSTVKVTLHSVGNYFPINSVISFYSSTSVGGLTISGDYVVTSVIDVDNININAGSAATSNATASENGGNVQIKYLLQSGNSSDTVAIGYGTGGYGSGGYGTGVSSASYTVPLRNWYFDNFGENLIALPTNGTLYQWTPPIANGNVATAVSGAPLYGSGMFVAAPQEQVVILGAETGGIQDPLLVRWSDVGGITGSGSWTASATNQAGSFRLSLGSAIIGGLTGALNSFIWTDTDLWMMVYQGYPFVYSFNTVGHSCGLIAPKAANFYNNAAFWMSRKGFFTYSPGGGVVSIPCTIWDWVFTRLDDSNKDKIFAAPNSLFNEMTWFFPSTDGDNPTVGEIDSYAKLNVAEGLWDYGRLVRTAWIDESIFGNPIGAHPTASTGTNIYQHEIGYDDNGVAMQDVFAESGYVDISDGTVFMFMDWLIPDFIWKTTNSTTQPRVNITIYTKYYPSDANPATIGPFTITPSTQYVSFRTRARQMAIKVESDAFDTFWRIGAIRVRTAPAGKV